MPWTLYIELSNDLGPSVFRDDIADTDITGFSDEDTARQAFNEAVNAANNFLAS